MSTSPNQYKIAIVGPHDTVSGMKLLGATPFAASNAQEALEALTQIKARADASDSNEKYAVVIIIEDLANQIDPDEYKKVTSGALPAIVAVPGLHGSKGLSLAKLRRLAEQAVGSDILG